MNSGLQPGAGSATVMRREFPLGLRIGFWACVAIALAVVVRRVVALIFPGRGGGPQMAALDAVFAGHASLTLAHILPAAGFVLLSPFALSPKFGGGRRVMIAFHALGLSADTVSAKRTLAGHFMGLGVGFVVFDCEHDNILLREVRIRVWGKSEGGFVLLIAFQLFRFDQHEISCGMLYNVHRPALFAWIAPKEWASIEDHSSLRKSLPLCCSIQAYAARFIATPENKRDWPCVRSRRFS